SRWKSFTPPEAPAAPPPQGGATRGSAKPVPRWPPDQARRDRLPSGNLLQAVAEAAHRGNANRAFLDLLAQPVDVDLDGVVAHLFAPFAQAFDQLVLAHETAGALQQDLEQAQLARGQLHHLALDGGDPAGLV